MVKIKTILAKWSSDGGVPNAGASSELLAALEECLGCTLPPVLRDLYSAANGMQDGTLDLHGVNFWPIEKIVGKNFVIESGPTQGIGFADVLIDSWFFLYRRTGEGAVEVVNQSTLKATSPETFWATYLDRPRSLDL
jgi:cell wall assembly regulator SMI1